MTPERFREELVKLSKACGSQSALAEKIGVTPPFLSNIIKGRKEPSGKVLSWLKYKKVIRYIQVKP